MPGNEMRGYSPGPSRVVRPVHSLASCRTEPPVRLGDFTYVWRSEPVPVCTVTISGGCLMSWTKPEFEVVEVTMEVTAYVARR